MTDARPTPATAAAFVRAWGVGLTGGIATGKSTVARMLRARGYVVIDADQLAREVVLPGTPGLQAVRQAFGDAVLDEGGALDRAALRKIVFAAPEARARLEAITHPLIRAALADALVREGLWAAPRPFFYEAALLYEAGRAGELKAVWATVCSRETQLARVMARDGASREDAEKILASQLDAREKAARADLAIDTEGSLAQLEARVDEALGGLA